MNDLNDINYGYELTFIRCGKKSVVKKASSKLDRMLLNLMVDHATHTGRPHTQDVVLIGPSAKI